MLVGVCDCPSTDPFAAMLVLTARRRRATWCHGVAPDPVQFHAWIEVDDAPVDEPLSTSRFTALLTT
ncbi:hypothetical protein GCM10028784_00770 [Myceligenerans cantabricum]